MTDVRSGKFKSLNEVLVLYSGSCDNGGGIVLPFSFYASQMRTNEKGSHRFVGHRCSICVQKSGEHTFHFQNTMTYLAVGKIHPKFLILDEFIQQQDKKGRESVLLI